MNLLAVSQCLHLDPGSSVGQKRAYILRACPYLGLSPKTFTRGIPEALSLIRALQGMGAIENPRLFSRSFIALVSIRGKFGVERGSIQLGCDKVRLVSDDPAVVVSCMRSAIIAWNAADMPWHWAARWPAQWPGPWLRRTGYNGTA